MTLRRLISTPKHPQNYPATFVKKSPKFGWDYLVHVYVDYDWATRATQKNTTDRSILWGGIVVNLGQIRRVKKNPKLGGKNSAELTSQPLYLSVHILGRRWLHSEVHQGADATGRSAIALFRRPAGEA